MSRGRVPKRRNSVPNEHRHASDNETLNEPRAQEPLNRDPTVDVTRSSELRKRSQPESRPSVSSASIERGARVTLNLHMIFTGEVIEG
jgi:hypothetical protein